MRTIFTAIAFIFFIGTTAAQDTIFKANGSVVAAKILEINSTEIKYKKFQFLDGPTYVENKTDIKSVKYSNGIKEDFAAQPVVTPAPKIIPAPTESGADYYSGKETLPSASKLQYTGTYFLYKGRKMNERQAQNMLLQTRDKEVIGLVQHSRDAHALKFIGFAAIPLGIGALYLLAESVTYTYSLNSTKLAGSGLCLIGAIACPIVSGIYSKKRKMYNEQATQLYNQRY